MRLNIIFLAPSINSSVPNNKNTPMQENYSFQMNKKEVANLREKYNFLSEEEKKLCKIKKNILNASKNRRGWEFQKNNPKKPDYKVAEIFNRYLGIPTGSQKFVESKMLKDGSRVEKIRAPNGYYCARIPKQIVEQC